MKIDRLETHDRLQHLHKDQAINISEGAQECLKGNNLSLKLQQYSPYVYIYAHPRTSEDGRSKRMIWQPRLTKPSMETNSYLFRAISNTDQIEICWLLPPKETWPQYKKGNVTEHAMVIWSIDQYMHHKPEMEKPFPDDLKDEKIKEIYLRVAQETDEEIRMDKLYFKQDS